MQRLISGGFGALLVLSLFSTTGSPLEAQHSGAQTVQCKTCRVQIRKIADLGNTFDYPGGFRYWPKSIARVRGGDFVAVQPGAGSHEVPWIFDPAGNFQGVIGRDGEGPGEYRVPSVVLRGPDDSIHVFDMQLGRRSVLSPDGRFVRSTPAPRNAFSAVILPDGGQIVSARVASKDKIGRPIHSLTAEGRYVRAFDLEEARAPQLGLPAHRSLALAKDGTIWSAPRTGEYRLEHLSIDGKVLEAVMLKRGWYPPYDRPAAAMPEQAPTPSIEGIWINPATGHLWVFAMISDRNWTQGLGEPTIAANAPSEGQMIPIEDFPQVFDGVVEVFELPSLSLLASVRTDQPLVLPAGDGYVGAPGQTAEGVHYISLYHVSLVHQN